MLSRIEFILTETFLSLRRHPGMALAAVFCMSSALLIAGIVGLAIMNAGHTVDNTMERIRFTVFFHPETYREEAESALARIQALPGVETAELITKEQAWEKLVADDPELAESLERNPYPDSVVIKPVDVSNIPEVKKEVQSWAEVDEVLDHEEISSYLERLRHAASVIGPILGLILTALSLVIVHHTIELTLYARRKEIFIMSLVGATPSTIAGPFLMEGVVYGFFGGGVALAVLYPLYNTLVNWVKGEVGVQLVHGTAGLLHGAILVLLAGMALGLVGSLLSVLKYSKNPLSKLTNA